ncbi:hypothetical protein SAMN04487981_103180 [Streptomyces sp. cf386]|uniref:hypothetical protein n=1 Tax=Streptomyces sp. cf386 TaxID=1761904 RepID=UPI0008844AA4|nr:hypothetical protein [Streptomyces sp. cf386]SDM99097.1 hypothetical protein SAMN04487981_103180 [Streptomyces sp. cf386]
MADEQYRWLDRETAERLLRGESLEAVDAAHRDQAEQLAKTLEALTAEPPLSSAELPGEDAALAAFRAARANRDDARATVGEGSGSAAAQVTDAGLIRIGAPGHAARRPRWGRPLRLGLAAALAVGMVGGVAVAAGTGVLRTPFGGDEPGRPAATVSEAAPPERPLVSPSPEIGAQDDPTPDGTSNAPTAPGATRGSAPGGPAADRETADADRDKPAGGWRTVVKACRDLRDGRELPRDRRRALEGAAGSSKRLWTYCKTVLTGAGESTRAQGDEREGDDGRDEDDGKGRGDDDGQDGGKGRDKGKGDKDRSRDRSRDNGHRTNGPTEAPSLVADLLPDRVQLPTPLVPSPSFRAL